MVSKLQVSDSKGEGQGTAGVCCFGFAGVVQTLAEEGPPCVLFSTCLSNTSVTACQGIIRIKTL